MKKSVITTVLTLLLASAAIAGSQEFPEEYLGLPGDNLNLYAVMKLFQESETLEGFERDLNAEETSINNLDLNNDGYVDYITVSDFVNGNVHTIVLRALLDRNEYQDVAVFTVEKLGNNEVQIQLIGDESLYGRNYIIEPYYAETPNPGYVGNATATRNNTIATRNNTTVVNNYYNASAWPVVRFIYSPRYVVWRSSWYWGYYPVYWKPWRSFYWHHYYGYHYNWYPTYYSYYRVWHRPRYVHYTTYYYTTVRVYSTNVSRRITDGNYMTTYSRPETRRDGESLYASTPVTRSTRTGVALTPGTTRREAPSTAARSTQSGETRRAAGATGTTRTTTTTQSGETRRAAGTTGTTRTTTTTQSGETRRAAGTTGTTRTTTTTQAGETRREAGTTGTTRTTTTTQSSETRRTTTPAAATQPVATSRSSSSTTSRSAATASRSASTSNRSAATASRSASTSNRSAATASRSASTSNRSATTARSQKSGSSSSARSSSSSGSSRSSGAGSSSSSSSRSARR